MDAEFVSFLSISYSNTHWPEFICQLRIEALTKPLLVCILPLRSVKRSLLCAEVVKLVDTLASGASGGNPVEVQVLSSAPNK